MRLTVRAHPGARSQRVVRCGPLAVDVWVRAPAHDGLANDAVVRLLSESLQIPRSAIRVVRGQTARFKQVEVDGMDEASLTEVVSRLESGT